MNEEQPEWEYKIVWFRLTSLINNQIAESVAATESELQSLGKQGWELVFAHNIGKPGIAYDMAYIFKRKRHQQQVTQNSQEIEQPQSKEPISKRESPKIDWDSKW